MMKKTILLLSGIITLISCSTSKKITRKKSLHRVQLLAARNGDTAKKDPKPYTEVVPGNAITDNGLFKVHKVNDRYLFEIPFSVMEKDILLVNRISKGSYNGNFTGYAGDYMGEEIIQFSKGTNNKLFIKRSKSYNTVRATDSTENGLYQAIQNTDMKPIIAVFEIKAISPDSSALVIDMTDFINSDNEFISFTSYKKTTLGYGLGGYLADRSYIQNILSHPLNVEIKTVKTYVRAGGGQSSAGVVSYEINNSIVLLPTKPMQPRYMDKRIGYFARGYYNYDASSPVDIRWMITRWRLEPKEGDIEKYLKGELVEPRKPIVYYIDPVTPKKWIPYLIQGVNDWQKAFEKAGFKNAIYALEAPVDDSTWSLEDSRNSVIVYKASDISNASGPHVGDPRSGEIIETHINWYHNILQILRDWYMIQAGPNDPGARTMQFDDALMGRLIRYVCAHEVGHTLGLQHNFGASSTISVDSLRNKNYLEENGFCPSIMDYARFNYVAQPEDGLDRESLMPKIGVYDEWAIEWGYRWFPAFKTQAEEDNFMNNWVTLRLQKDKRLWFGAQTAPIPDNPNPLRQAEDLGDDAIKASYYGILNLKRIVPKLKEWTKVANKDYESLNSQYSQLKLQYLKYIDHVATYIGGRIWSDKSVNEKDYGASFPEKRKQKAAVKFIHDELFSGPHWLFEDEIFRISVGEGFGPFNGRMGYIYLMDQAILNRIISYPTFYGLLLAQTSHPENAYSIDELLNDLVQGIWRELVTRSTIDIYRRNLQKLYIKTIIGLVDPVNIAKNQRGSSTALTTDIYSVLKNHLRELLEKINHAMPYYKDKMSSVHLAEVSNWIKSELDNVNEKMPPVADMEHKSKAFNYLFRLNTKPTTLDDIFQHNETGCWPERKEDQLF